MAGSRSLVAVLALGAVVAVVALGAGAYALPDPAPLPAPGPAPFGPFKDLASQVQKGVNTAVNTVKGAVKRMRVRCHCKDSDLSCRCCSPINVPEVKFNKKVCIKTRFRITDFAAIFSVLVDSKSVVQRTISVSSTPPICVPVPKFPVLRICARAHGLGINKGKLRVCPDLEVLLLHNPVVTVSFDCAHVKLPKRRG